ncbi:flagellar FliJ family protein [Craterilacuibacter sp.]|uniref:flagellar FliJ family protein n=1 Tax=Craterilacuibacter sp. TaxID=2870909 RepID=UPI003F31CF51
MNARHHLQTMSLMLNLRQRDVERAADELKAKHALQSRYRRNIERLDALGAAASSSTAFNASQALNMSAYKGQLATLRLGQQQDLALSLADAEISRQALVQARLKREAMAQVRDVTALRLSREGEVREQKRTDDAAVLSWQRQQHGR